MTRIRVSEIMTVLYPILSMSFPISGESRKLQIAETANSMLIIMAFAP